MIAAGGTLKGKGLGLFEHLMNARKLLWPHRYRHRWTDLMYREFIKNDVSILMGCASAQKTSHSVEFCLINYFARPHKTMVILSSTTLEKLDIGCWAELKTLWKQASELWPTLAGNLVEYKRAIATDDVEEGGRDFRCGCICRPCYRGGTYVGDSVLAGAKQDYIFFVADELSFMESSFSRSWPHLFSNPHVKIIGSGNPKGDPDDQLSISAEPREGWPSIGEPTETACWDTRFMGGRCINLVGTDSPNFDVPEGTPEPYPKLIGRSFAKRIEHDQGLDSYDYYKLVKGVMKLGMAVNRVITRQLCREHHAHDKAMWGIGKRKKLHSLDPSYGGKDACVSTLLEFGPDPDGKIILQIIRQHTHRFSLNIDKSVEDQIAEQVFDMLKLEGIEPSASGYDSVGKGTLGFAFARKFGSDSPVPIDSGAKPTERQVRQDLFIVDKGQKRHKKCSEHYSKFITEAWFSVRYVIEADQMRELPEACMMEGCARVYEEVAGNKIEIEPKDDLKERTGKSPNLFDSLAVGVEMARRHGFKIGRLGLDSDDPDQDPFAWMAEKAKKQRELMDKKQLSYAT